MKGAEYYISVCVAGLCVVLSALLFALAGSARGVQSDIQKLQTQYQMQQVQINSGVTLGQQVAPSIFKDLSAFPEDVSFKALIARHGSDFGTNNK